MSQDQLLTVADVIRQYQEQRTDVGHLDAARERIRHLRLFCVALGHRPVAEVKAHEMLKYLQTSFLGRSPWTLRRIVVTIKAPFNWAAKYGLIDRNPFAAVSQEQGEPGRMMTEEEFRTVLRTTGAPGRKENYPGSSALFRRVLVFIRGVGCRPAECARLEWSMYDEPNARFLLQRHKTEGKKRGKPRVLILTRCLVKLIDWIRRHNPHPRCVFVTSYGNRWTPGAMQKRMRRLVIRAGLHPKVTLYGARRLFGTTAIMNGVDLSTAAELMGNSPEILQKHYVHLSGQIDHLRAKAENGMPAHKPVKPLPPPTNLPLRCPPPQQGDAPPPRSYWFSAGA
jgi:integrase